VHVLREAAALGAACLVTRGELAALELAEARDRAALWLMLAFLAAALLIAALLVGSLWVVSVFWDSYRSQAIALVAGIYALGGGGLAVWLLARLRASRPLLQVTLDELKRDVDALRGTAGGRG
jgi:uncharacterized membrane protein YqjE